ISSSQSASSLVFVVELSNISIAPTGSGAYTECWPTSAAVADPKPCCREAGREVPRRQPTEQPVPKWGHILKRPVNRWNKFEVIDVIGFEIGLTNDPGGESYFDLRL